jgi:hypothetical protein
MGEHRNAGGGVTLLLAEKVCQFTCYRRIGLQSRDHAKKRKETTGKILEGNILLMTRHFIGSNKTIIVIIILMLTNITINRLYSIGSTSQLRSITLILTPNNTMFIVKNIAAFYFHKYLIIFINRNTPRRVWAGTKNSRPVGFLL